MFRLLLLVFSFEVFSCKAQSSGQHFFPASDTRILYTGRVDFINPQLPRFWQPGVYIDFNYRGDRCSVIINDEVLWGKSHNYIEIEVDGVGKRMRLQSAKDTLEIVAPASVSLKQEDAVHQVRIMKNTEANIGWMEFGGIIADTLTTPVPRKMHRIEFIGNSITCGAGSDESEIPCGKGDWQDQHNVYQGFAALTAKALEADFHLSSVSGIGLMHSCCDLGILMPEVFDKISMRNDSISWDFGRFQPEVVAVCLGQNDGVQPAEIFVNTYLHFLQQLRAYYPAAKLVCLTSPMADATLSAFMKKALQAVVAKANASGEDQVYTYAFSRQYSKGCDFHPSLAEHTEIAGELTQYLRTIISW